MQAVKQLYRDLDLEQVYRTYEEESYQAIQNLIAKVDKVAPAILNDFAKRIYKRSK